MTHVWCFKCSEIRVLWSSATLVLKWNGEISAEDLCKMVDREIYETRLLVVEAVKYI